MAISFGMGCTLCEIYLLTTWKTGFSDCTSQRVKFIFAMLRFSYLFLSHGVARFVGYRFSIWNSDTGYTSCMTIIFHVIHVYIYIYPL